MTHSTLNRIALALGVAAAMFVGLGSVAALWENPLFVRMTPVGGFEVTLLVVLSGLAGIYVALPRPACAQWTAGGGGVLGFLGIACPVCNKILLLLFGSSLLLEYYEPVRLYVTLAGIALLSVAIRRKTAGRGCEKLEAA
ncbi:MAG: hypothetical protein R3298_01250 [Gammaproteobacteria bacterium]|nr:hypothetical protein [Gammaproteobacteria bacterium]